MYLTPTSIDLNTNASTSFSGSAPKQGYTSIGIVGIAGSGTSYCCICEYTVSSIGSITLYLKNVHSVSVNVKNVRVFVLYKKS